MGGNDKLKPSDLNDWKYLEASAQLLLGSPTNPAGVLLFMTSPGAECTTTAFEKHKVWPKGDMLEGGLIAA
jgi:hypothetical protein